MARVAAGLFLLSATGSEAAAAVAAAGAFTQGTCGAARSAYKDAACCGAPDKATPFHIVPKAKNKFQSNNPCAGKKPAPGAGFDNFDCMKDGIVQATEQAGANVTLGYKGKFDTNSTPITTSYLQAGLCPVNVHWHLGAEHLSVGEFDENGKGPAVDNVADAAGEGDSRRLARNARLGFRCHHYDKNDEKFTKEYKWQHCVDMKVGETYEVHWPHSAAGMCGTPYQYQTPFYDGVLCNSAAVTATLAAQATNPSALPSAVGVQSQVFTIVNDEDYYYPDLIRGMIVDGDYGTHMTKYTGSTTGTSRDNKICSAYSPITWQVDRKCHIISASSFDKMCADMKQQADDMSDDLHAHGARTLVADHIAADNHQRRLEVV